MYAERMKVKVTDQNGKRMPVWFGSYGIGPSRLLGTYAEVFHDEKGLLWPKQVAPYQVHLVDLNPKAAFRQETCSKQASRKPKLSAEEIYEKLVKAGIEVLYDDREGVSAGEKFADADLIGIPVRLVVSEKSLAAGGVELKLRSSDKSTIIPIKDLASEMAKV
jgi:prolyl-tRNA synthetase